jgi:hypothetical protein
MQIHIVLQKLDIVLIFLGDLIIIRRLICYMRHIMDSASLDKVTLQCMLLHLFCDRMDFISEAQKLKE